jgi:glycogen operon protein
MLSHGDEMGRTQLGNNNAYCQDNPLTWVHWDLDRTRRDLLAFTRRIFEIRAANPVLRRRGYFRHDAGAPPEERDLWWLRSDGAEMTADDWSDASSHVLGMLIRESATDERDEHGEPAAGETVLLLLNGGGRTRRFVLPALAEAGGWEEMVNTARAGSRPVREGAVSLVAHSLMLLRYRPAG